MHKEYPESLLKAGQVNEKRISNKNLYTDFDIKVYEDILNRVDEAFQSCKDSGMLDRLICLGTSYSMDIDIDETDYLFALGVFKIRVCLSLKEKPHLVSNKCAMVNLLAYDKLYYYIDNLYINTDFFNKTHLNEMNSHIRMNIVEIVENVPLNYASMGGYDISSYTGYNSVMICSPKQLKQMLKFKFNNNFNTLMIDYTRMDKETYTHIYSFLLRIGREYLGKFITLKIVDDEFDVSNILNKNIHVEADYTYSKDMCIIRVVCEKKTF